MRSAKVLGESLVNLDLIRKNVEPKLEELSFLRPFHEELSGLIDRVRDLDGQLEQAKGLSRQMAHERREAMKRAENLGRRIATHLRASLDFTNERLADFGIKPRPRVTRPRTRRRKEQGPDPAAKPAVTTTSQ
jgi:hypothetical protein